MTRPRGNAGKPGTTSKIAIRLPSKEVHRAIYDASRGHGRSINDFAVDAILASLSALGESTNDPHATGNNARSSIAAESRVQSRIAKCKSDDAFELITIEQLNAIARAAKVTDNQAYQVIKALIQRCS